ncbi:MAG: redoxin domain-containing protein [Planctomycetes bacterium]|nr:redoxin domain-containing protein [Planctomycetota bacterium]
MRVLRWQFLIVCALLLGPPARADQEYDELLKGFREAQQKFYADYQKAMEKSKNESTSMPAFDMANPPFMAEFRSKFQKYAEKMAGKPDAIPALVWMITSERGGPSDKPSETVKSALETLQKSHLGQAEIADSLDELQYSFWSVGRKPLIELYEAIIKENKDKAAQAAASFNLAFLLYSGHGDDMPPEMKGAAGDKERAQELFRKVAGEYKGTPAAEKADGYVYEMEHLQIGMVAPEFEGGDVEGKTIKLSQFRGQVVVLDFWGFW